jgi:serine/threonine protein kinase
MVDDGSMDGSDVDAGLRCLDAPAPGQVLDGRYELVSVIGEGTFGEVWSAVDLRLGDTVAVKLAKGSSALVRFDEEISLLVELRHAGIVALRDRHARGSPSERPFFVMEYCESNLEKWMAESGRLDGRAPHTIASIFLDLCRAVAFVHDAGRIHRDLKPANVLLRYDRRGLVPRLADFGIARALPECGSLATRGVGTEPYLSPELGLGIAPDAASDVFALAVILIELLTGEREPEPGLSWWRFVTSAAVTTELEDDASPVDKRIRAMLPPPWRDTAVALLARALSARREVRPTALHLGEQFEQIARGTLAQPAARRRASGAGIHFPIAVSVVSAIGYLVSAVPPVLVDPLLTTRQGFGARTYPQAWLIAPLSGLVLLGTWLLLRASAHRPSWQALLPLVIAEVATVPILSDIPHGEIPHGSLVVVSLMWLVITSLWLAARYSLNSIDDQNRRLPSPERGRLFVLLVIALLLVIAMALPVLVFMRAVNREMLTDPREIAILDNLSYGQFGAYALFWLAGPTREIGIAWSRARTS